MMASTERYQGVTVDNTPEGSAPMTLDRVGPDDRRPHIMSSAYATLWRPLFAIPPQNLNGELKRETRNAAGVEPGRAHRDGRRDRHARD